MKELFKSDGPGITSIIPGSENTPGMPFLQGEVPPPSTSRDIWQPPRRSRKKLTYGTIATLLAVPVILTGCYVLFFSKWLTSSVPVTFHSSKCPFHLGSGLIDGRTVKCGFLTVPEVRDDVHSASIQLAVAIFKAPQPKVDSIPMLYLAGGPGGEILGSLAPFITSQNLKDFTMGRDFILLDQRGAGYSKPALTCHEFTDSQKSTPGQKTSPDSAIAWYQQPGKACHDRLERSGVSLSAYTTIDNAMDVHDLIHALGYEQVNLYGVSYGTRLAQTVMRLFPGDLRSVILDSPLPTQNNLFTTYPAMMQHAYDLLLNSCAINSRCHAKYPQLTSVFYKLINDLNAKPVTIQDAKYGSMLLNGDLFASWIFSAMYVTKYIPILPDVIMLASKGDYTFISKVYSYLIIRNDIAMGVYYSVECGEDLAFSTKQGLARAANALRPELRRAGVASLLSAYSVCQSWRQSPVPDVQKQPVTSSIPTLVLSGEYDPITPSSNGQTVEKTLSKSYFFLFPAGHGVYLSGTCPDLVISTFMANPSQRPNESCVTAQRPFFSVSAKISSYKGESQAP